MKLSKLFLLVTGTISIGIAISVYFLAQKNHHSPITQDSLSPRAQEFIDSQKSDGTGFWSQTRLNESTASSSLKIAEGVVNTDCFTFILPFQVTDASTEVTEARCTWKAKIISPHGLLIVSRYPIKDFYEDSGVTLRKNDTKKYQEIPLSVESLDNVAFFRSDEDLTVFAGSGKFMITVSITNMFNPAAVDSEYIKNILSSMNVKKI